MLSGILKLTLFISILSLFIILLCQTTAAETSPIAANGAMAKSNEDAHHGLVNNNYRGIGNRKFRGPHRLRPLLDHRLKRFRMLDPDEFKEMLNNMGQKTPYEQLKELNSLDNIGGIQVENYWSRK